MRRLLIWICALCVAPACKAPPENPSSGFEKFPRCGTDSPKVGGSCSIREATSPELAGHDVGVADIFERDLPDLDGGTARRLSAAVVTFDPKTKTELRHTAIVGSVLAIGGENYRVTAIDRGKDAPGWLVLRRLP